MLRTALNADFSAVSPLVRYTPPIADASLCLWLGEEAPYWYLNHGTAGGECEIEGSPLQIDALFRRFNKSNYATTPITRTDPVTVMAVIRDSATMPIGTYTDQWGYILTNERESPGNIGGGVTMTGSISGTTLTVTATDKPVNVGLLITGSGVTASTRITAQLTSAEPGGALAGKGTYSVNNSQTVASTALTGTDTGRRGFHLFRDYETSSGSIGLGFNGTNNSTGATVVSGIQPANTPTAARFIIAEVKTNVSTTSTANTFADLTNAASSGPTNGASAQGLLVQSDEADFPLRIGKGYRTAAVFGADIDVAFVMAVPRAGIIGTAEATAAYTAIKKRFTALGVTI